MKPVRVFGIVSPETGEFENFSEHKCVFDTHTAVLSEVETLKIFSEEETSLDLLKEISEKHPSSIPYALRSRVKRTIGNEDI